jgi:hypothetical protein
MIAEWLAMEHYRLHTIERWPEGANKDAALASVRSALEGLLRCESPPAAPWECMVCAVAAQVSATHLLGTYNPEGVPSRAIP